MKSVEKRIRQTMYACGQLMLDAHGADKEIAEKSGEANFVTKYDREIQRILRQQLGEIMPEAHFVGEEEETHESVASGYAFVVDPIDGTTNFIMDYRCSVISVGLLKDGKPYMGMIYNPYMDELFYAKKGAGAYVNDRRIFATNRHLSDTIVLFGSSPYIREYSDASFDYLRRLFYKALDVRRSGAAAWDLCSIAAGRAGVFFEMNLQPWDIAAGAVLIEEAGGIITTLEKNPPSFDGPCSVLAAGKTVFEELPDFYEW